MMDNTRPTSIRSFLIERYRNFRLENFPKNKAHFAEIARSQNPHVLFIGCSDSRVVPNVVLAGLPGDIFECRIVGNIVPAYGSALGGVSATLEYAISVLDVQALIICGHSDCGAMKALQDPKRVAAYESIAKWLLHADAAKRVVGAPMADTDPDRELARLTRENVIAQLANVHTHPAVAQARRRGLEVFGWVYDIESGQIECYDESTREFMPLEDCL